MGAAGLKELSKGQHEEGLEGVAVVSDDEPGGICPPEVLLFLSFGRLCPDYFDPPQFLKDAISVMKGHSLNLPPRSLLMKTNALNVMAATTVEFAELNPQNGFDFRTPPKAFHLFERAPSRSRTATCGRVSRCACIRRNRSLSSADLFITAPEMEAEKQNNGRFQGPHSRKIGRLVRISGKERFKLISTAIEDLLRTISPAACSGIPTSVGPIPLAGIPRCCESPCQ